MGNDIFKENSEIQENIEEKKGEEQLEEEQIIQNNLKMSEFIKEIFDCFLNKKSFQIYESLEEVPQFDTKPYNFYKYPTEVREDNTLLLSNYSYNFSMDILCAIYCKKPIEINIYIDKYFITRQHIPANSYFMPRCGPILISNLKYWPVIKVLTKDPGQIQLVYGVFSKDFKKYVKNNIFYTSYIKNKDQVNDLVYYKERIYLNEESEIIRKENKSKIIKIPEFYLNTEEYKQILANKVSDEIREELVAVAMHPDRLESFLSVDEIKIYLHK